MFDLVHLCPQYELLKLLAQNLTAHDLFSMALACTKLHELILKSTSTFSQLKSLCLCDGSGLKSRQAEAHRADARQVAARTLERHSVPYIQREDIETLKQTRCDVMHTSTCIRCGFNVCEECSGFPRVGNNSYGPCRRPHLTTTYQNQNIICYCYMCDEDVEKTVGSELCDCDRYTRWICHSCHKQEVRESGQYFTDCASPCDGPEDEDGGDDIGMILHDHQCGIKVSPL